MNLLIIFKEIIGIQRRKNEQEKFVLEKGSEFEGKLCKFQGRDALGERCGA